MATTVKVSAFAGGVLNFDKIVEVRDGGLHRYEGGYSAWMEFRFISPGLS